MPKEQQSFPGKEHEMTPKPDYGEESYRGSGKLTGKSALITGGDSGIGRAVALAFAREGADVMIAYLPDEEKDAQVALDSMKQAGHKAVGMAGDVQDEAFCRQLVERAVREFGRLDILVNNAAYQKPVKSITEVTQEELERHFRTNLFAMFYLCKAAVPNMKPGASIINTASIQSYHPSPMLLPYATTKGAIRNFTEALAEELGQKGIRVNGVAPGPIWTPLIPSGMPPDAVQSFGKNTPLGRPGQPAELAGIYVLLASDEGSYMSGGIYPVTGGKMMV